MRVVSDEKSNIISSSILEKRVTFTPKEFNLVIGLRSTSAMVEKDTCCERLRELILGPRVPNEKEKTCLKIEEAFKQFSFTTDKDVLASFIKVVMVEKNKKTLLDVETLGIIDVQEMELRLVVYFLQSFAT